MVVASALSGCAYHRPHSVVATNIRPTADPMTGGSRRVEAEVCGNRLLAIPFGPEPRASVLMTDLQRQVPSAVGFEDIHIDVAFINYLYPLFWQDCVYGSATPLVAVTKPRPRPPAPGTTPPPPPPLESSPDAPSPKPRPDPFAE